LPSQIEAGCKRITSRIHPGKGGSLVTDGIFADHRAFSACLANC
jgi:hypothetical protein